MSKISSKLLYERTISFLKNLSKRDAINILQKYLYLKLNLSNTDILLDRELDLNRELEKEIKKDLKKISLGTPIQYVVNKEFFYDNVFYVNENVLIPRPETEELVDLIIKNEMKSRSQHILDIGTGSGCIAITLDKKIQGKVDGLDISDEAISVAKRNNFLLNANVNFFKSDILNYLPQKKYDIIVSNPPYIPKKDIKYVAVNVKKNEPPIALYVDNDPLYFYKKIIKFSFEHLNKKGKLYFEINEQYGKEIAELLQNNFQDIGIVKDIYGKDRIVKATRI